MVTVDLLGDLLSVGVSSIDCWRRVVNELVRLLPGFKLLKKLLVVDVNVGAFEAGVEDAAAAIAEAAFVTSVTLLEVVVVFEVLLVTVAALEPVSFVADAKEDVVIAFVALVFAVVFFSPPVSLDFLDVLVFFSGFTSISLTVSFSNDSFCFSASLPNFVLIWANINK